MVKALCALLLALMCGCTSLKDTTHAATALDATTTVIGVSSGLAVEANPLISSPAVFVGMMLTRVVMTEYVNTLPEPQRTQYLSGMSSLWLGGGIANIAVLIISATASAVAMGPLAPAFGIMAGLGWWQSTADQRLFAAMCAAERATNPKMECMFRGVAM